MTIPILFTFAILTSALMRREQQGNYEKPNCKMWSAVHYLKE